MSDVRDRLQVSLGSAYLVERELGGGGMSRTYVATERALSRRVVVKVLAPELLAGISVERFKREVLLAAQLQHPHIVPVLTTGDADGLPWFTMPYVEGESLRMRLARGPLPMGEITGILRDVARALDFAHAHHVVHRDIKPDNVLLAGTSATVTDFGIAKAITAARTDGGGTETGLTMTGQAIGTPAYMAPEQAAGDHHADPRSDIYSYGVLAYELLAGRPPFVASSAIKVIGAHLTETPRPIQELRADVPPALRDLVMRCLEKDVANRPQSATDLVRVLDAMASSATSDIAPRILLGGHIRLGRALSLWSIATLLVAVTAWAATNVIGLPDWVLPGSLGVMLAGLPMIALTWYVQRTVHRAFTATPAVTPGGSESGHGTFATLAIKASPHFSWRRTSLGGAVAVGAFAILVIGFMVLRALGIGPVGSLMAAGKLDKGETLVVADFRGPPGDSTLGGTVAEALRTDLDQSQSLDVMTRAAVRDVLRLMQRPVESAVHFELAREIATREGAKAVLDGEVVKLGTSYIVSARLVSTLDGVELATFRRTAADENDLIAALGGLTRDIRGKIGESLKDIREATPLERVSTSSLPALRKYVEGVHYTDDVGDTPRGLALLEEAVAIDSTFAMAWRKLAAVVGNTRTDRPRQMEAAARAFRHRERLSENERLATEAYYYTSGPEPNLDRALAVYETMLQRDPENMIALNNAGVGFAQKGEWAKAEERYRAGTVLKRPFGTSFYNLLIAQVRQGKLAAAESTLGRFRERFPTHENGWEAEFVLRWGRSDIQGADSLARSVWASAKNVRQRRTAAAMLASLSLLRGKTREGMRWRAAEHDVIYRATRAPEQPLLAVTDSADAIAFFWQDLPRARAMVRRALARWPLQEMPAASRPWNALGELAIALRDGQLAREFQDGFERDIPALGLVTVDAERARMRAWVAMASSRYDDAVAALREAESSGPIFQFDRRAMVGLAEAFDLGGKPDSALAYYERFLKTPAPYPHDDAFFRAGTYKRLGELYEARGDFRNAEAYYARFVELWHGADPELQPTVREVRDRLTRLRRQQG